MVTPLLKSDIAPFIFLAKEEGWICAEWELEFLLRNFPQGCLVRREAGCALGYITSIGYEKSGWIGNLLVSRESRRRGIGKTLMESALDALLRSGVETVWLTASAEGAGLYRRLGFLAVDGINRWTREGRIRAGEKPPPFDMEAMRKVDRAGWGDRRDALLESAFARGRLYGGGDAFLCCQPWEQGTQLGPWGALAEYQAEHLLDLALTGAAGRVFLDVPAGNLAAAGFLAKRGFKIRGSNSLMYLGVPPLYEPKKIFALASMGSMG